MLPRWVIAKKEFVSVFTERTILLAVIIQVFVAGFSSFLVVGLSALVDPESLPSQVAPTVAVSESYADGSDVDLRGLRLSDFLASQGLVIREARDAESALSDFHRGSVDGAVVLVDPADATKPFSVRLVLPDGDLRATFTLVRVKAGLEEYEQSLRAARDDRLRFEPLYVETDAKAGSFSFVYALLVPLLVFLPVVLAGALTADSLTEEVQRGTLPLLLASPATPADVVEGKLMANVAVAPLLGVAWFLLLGLNGLSVPLGGALVILVLATAIAYVMGLLACVIALLTRDRNKAHVLYATALFFLLAMSLALPVSPVNAVALLAAGSPSAGAYALVAGTVALAAAGWVALRVLLRRTATWMAAGGA